MKTETEVVQQKTPAVTLIYELDELARSGKYGEVALCTSKGRIFSWQTHRQQNLLAALKNHGDVWGFICVSEDENKSVVSTVWTLGDDYSELGTYDKIEDMQVLLGSAACVWEAWKEDHRGLAFEADIEWKFCPKCGEVINDDEYTSDQLFGR